MNQETNVNAITTHELDRLLASMIQTAEGISDLLFVAGKRPQVEVHGALESPEFEPAEPVLTASGSKAWPAQFSTIIPSYCATWPNTAPATAVMRWGTSAGSA
jgi:hypothetical protein